MTLYPLKFQVEETSKYLNASDREFNLLNTQTAIVTNGFLQENTLEELMEIYMYDLLGESVFKQFGNAFPLVVSLINADNTTSIFVETDHQNEALKGEKLWYILDSKDGEVAIGWNTALLGDEINHADSSAKMNTFSANQGDVFRIPLNEAHRINGKVTLFEINPSHQNTNGTQELKLLTDDQKQEVNKASNVDFKVSYKKEVNGVSNLQKGRYLTTNTITVNGTIARDYYPLDSFVLICCTEGSLILSGEFDEPVPLVKGECALIPADIKEIQFSSLLEAGSFLESYIDLKDN